MYELPLEEKYISACTTVGRLDPRAVTVLGFLDPRYQICKTPFEIFR